MELELERKRRLLDDGYLVIPGVVPRPLIETTREKRVARIGCTHRVVDSPSGLAEPGVRSRTDGRDVGGEGRIIT